MQVRIVCIIMLFGLCAVVSCKQDPIFFIIASETAPQKPLIDGAPTNMVKFEREVSGEKVPIMYVASGSLHWYAKDPADNKSKWNIKEYAIPQPGGKIIALAATANRLYALCLRGSSVDADLRYIGSGDSKWETVESAAADYRYIQSIYADPESAWLFAGARKNSKDKATYAILYLDGSDDSDDKLNILIPDTAIFSGVEHREDQYYLCTKGKGIYQIADAALEQLGGNSIDDPGSAQLKDNSDDGKKDRNFMGIIKLEDNTIIAVERNGGALFQVENGSFAQMLYTLVNNSDKIATGKYSTGALALWAEVDPDSGEPTGDKMLIAGIQGGLYSTSTSSYTHGYVEFTLKSDGSFDTGTARLSPPSLQSVLSNDQYTASIGKHPINHLFQAPPEIDNKMTFFASTQTAGLWSYRKRSPDKGGEQWNAEAEAE